MKKLLLCYILLSFFKITSQVVFCPPGSQWSYTFRKDFYPPWVVDNETIAYVGDVVINGETVKQLTHGKCFYQLNRSTHTGPSYLKQNGDTVFFKNIATGNNWQILFNFACSTGQAWTNTLNPGNGNITYTWTVNSVGTVTVNGFSLKEMSVTCTFTPLLSSSGSYTATVTERIGSSGFLFNFISRAMSDGDYFSEKLCYRDDVFGARLFSQHPCNYYQTLGINENEKTGFTVYPNPAGNNITIELTNELHDGTLTLTNMVGQLVKEVDFTGDSQHVSMRELPNGIYIVKISAKNNTTLFYQKLVKE